MGVLGITPFLQRTCPQVIKQLPDRLQSLAGKTIVIDGTLITQRLHFAAMPHKYRHVFGWYKLIEELKESNVNAICVFDGTKRSKAKAREVARRKDATRLTALRGTLEAQRLDRLKKLTSVYSQFEQLDTQEQLCLSHTLLSNLEQMGGPPNITLSPEAIQRVSNLQTTDGILSSATDSEITEPLPEVSPPSQIPSATQKEKSSWKQTPSMEQPIYRRRADEPRPFCGVFDPFIDDPSDFIPLDELSLRPDAQSLHTKDAQAFEPLPEDLVAVSTPGEGQDIASSLLSLYADYTKTSSEIVEISKTLPVSPQETVSDYVMTKSQIDLSIEEGKFWEQLMSLTQTTPTIETIAKKSSLMSESFDRRTNLPTAQTYEECKMMIDAMGVPCIDVEGEYEAEAVASSIVINGLADFVASEDTDVLVYQAPLLRNITNRQGSLVLISGSEVREVLALSSASFLDFALLLGTDFTQRIKNVGPARAYKFIREHGSIESIVEKEVKYPPQDPLEVYLERVEVAREVFRTLPPVPAKDLITQKEENRAKVQELLKRFRIEKLISSDNWDPSAALAGNYFQDKPDAPDIDTY